MSGYVLGGFISRDMEYGGALKIIETTRRASTTERLKVALFDVISLSIVQSSWSDAETGEIAFDHIRPGFWLLTVFDYTGEYAPASMIREATVDGARP